MQTNNADALDDADGLAAVAIEGLDEGVSSRDQLKVTLGAVCSGLTVTRYPIPTSLARCTFSFRVRKDSTVTCSPHKLWITLKQPTTSGKPHLFPIARNHDTEKYPLVAGCSNTKTPQRLATT